VPAHNNRLSLATISVFSSNDSSLRDQIAAVAARFIAEDGLDYAGAKERAVREVIGEARHRHVDCMPDNARVQAAVREHQALFMADTQPLRLAHLRAVARDVMRFLIGAGPDLEPFVTGAIVNGTAGEHSDVHLVVFDDNAKDIEIFLLNTGIDFEVAEAGSRNGETLSFLWPQRSVAPSPFGSLGEREAIHLTVLDRRDQRVASNVERANLVAFEKLLESA
jgi:hypothetical protein